MPQSEWGWTTSSNTWKQLGDATRLLLCPAAPQAQDSSKELDGHLAISADHMDSLKSFPAVCKLSVKLNMPLIASAACERLFSIAGLVFSPRRARLHSSVEDEQQIL
ncbi:hypothetical protein AAFF_G00124100 [Aldrovandia affinis]|uniref:HAT C-terminal dimerisation domain-containing protein n=1 Tax=Aldrovandia affinis TaxID=143900 RepID=A0AAD7RRW9_9TELE|nr:hypothetical protein AAFF_G00124100 [Aldrovandia affinis]